VQLLKCFGVVNQADIRRLLFTKTCRTPPAPNTNVKKEKTLEGDEQPRTRPKRPARLSIPCGIRIAGSYVYNPADKSKPCYLFVGASYPERGEPVEDCMPNTYLALGRASGETFIEEGRYTQKLTKLDMTGPGSTPYNEINSNERCLESFFVKWKPIALIPKKYSRDMGSHSGGEVHGQLSINIPYVHIVNDDTCMEYDGFCTDKFFYDLINAQR